MAETDRLQAERGSGTARLRRWRRQMPEMYGAALRQRGGGSRRRRAGLGRLTAGRRPGTYGAAYGRAAIPTAEMEVRRRLNLIGRDRAEPGSGRIWSDLGGTTLIERQRHRVAGGQHTAGGQYAGRRSPGERGRGSALVAVQARSAAVSRTAVSDRAVAPAESAEQRGLASARFPSSLFAFGSRMSMPPAASPEPVLDLLSPEWCSSAIQIFQPAATHDEKNIADFKGSSQLMKLEHTERRAVLQKDNNSTGEVRAVPPLKIDDLKSWIWLQQAIHPEVDYDRCLQKRWLSQKITPWKSLSSIKKWAAEMKQRRKEEGRLQKAEVHAAVSVARVAAALAAVAAENAELNQSKTSKEKAVAAAAALVAAQCAQAAEAVGAKREQIASTMSAAMATTDATDILTSTAAAATSLRGAATLRGRTGYKKGAQKSLLTLPTEELDFDLGKCIDSLAKGTELPVVTQDGNCRIRLVSVYLNKNGKVILRTKKINALVPFATGKESVVHNLHSSTEAKVVTSPEENSSYSIIMATSQGITKLKMKDYVCYRIWITSISQMLMLSTNLSNYELQLYGDN